MDFDDLDECEAEREAEEQAQAEREAAEKAEAERKAAEERAAAEAARRAEAAAKGEKLPDEVKLWEPLAAEEWAALPPIGRGDCPKNMKEFKEVVNKEEVGEYWGILFPFTPAMLREMGPEWLTKAMHKAGTLPKDNAVTKFLKFDVKAEDVTKEDAENAKWGGAGLKILLQVEYKNGPGNLTTGMFIKMPHAFTGKNERYKNSVTSAGMDWSEVTWYNIFGGRFGVPPFRSPKMYFCDMCRKTTNFVNIVEMVEHGPRGNAEVLPGEPFPPPEKYKDWDLPNKGVDYYYAHAKTLAQFFGWYFNLKSKTNQIDQLFMDQGTIDMRAYLFGLLTAEGEYASEKRDKWVGKALQDPSIQGMAMGMGFPPNICQGFLEMGKDFITSTAPHMFPKENMGKAYLDGFFKECEEMTKYAYEINWHAACIPEYFTLIHPNAQVDNAFYWRDLQDGSVQCGLLDWGGVNAGTIPACIGGGWIGMEVDVADEHEEKLVKVFIDEFEKTTGFKYDFDDLYMHIKLQQASVIFGCMANIGMLLRIIPRDQWKNIKNRHDSKIENLFLARCYYVQIEMFLGMWRKRNPYKFFKKWLQKTGRQPKP